MPEMPGPCKPRGMLQDVEGGGWGWTVEGFVQ